jgi:GNAT superfamily N-acetyltransferase
LELQPLSPANEFQALALMHGHMLTSLFLFGNLMAHGPVAKDHLNSGNFMVLLDGGRVRAVFVLSQRGHLLVQSDRLANYATEILKACAAEPIAISGIVGDWALVESLWYQHMLEHPRWQMTYCERELLFHLALNRFSATGDSTEVGLLEEADYDIFRTLTLADVLESGVPDRRTEEQRQQQFAELVRDRRLWGYRLAGKVVSMAALNETAGRVGQIGGVYTLPEHRRKGLSRATMAKLAIDCVSLHDLDRLVLFTGEQNHAAQALYRGMGFVENGAFGLVFGEERA